FSIFSIHFIGGFGNTFRSKDDRRKGSMIMGLFAVCSAIFIRVVIIANVVVFGDPSSFVRAALLTVVISFIALILLLPGIHENETVKKRYFQIYEFLELQKMPYFKLLKLAFKQKGYVTFTIAITLVQCARILRIASELYMIKDVLNLDMTVIALLAFFFIICLVPSMIVSSYIVKKIGHANLWTIGLILLVFVYLSALWVTTLTHLIILYAFYGVASGAQSSVAYAMIADTNDEVVNAAGRHVEGTLGGVRTFFVRVAYIATGAIIAGVHLTTGYIPGASTQTPLALMGIRMHYGGVPALFVGIAAILMIKFYDIKGEKREQLMASLKAKRL
ncbi:MAG: MFS transporter, partial [Promethearchaeota archaeon]